MNYFTLNFYNEKINQFIQKQDRELHLLFFFVIGTVTIIIYLFCTVVDIYQ